MPCRLLPPRRYAVDGECRWPISRQPAGRSRITSVPCKHGYVHGYRGQRPDDARGRAQYFAGQRATGVAEGMSRIAMSRPVRVVREQTTMSDAAHLMVTERISVACRSSTMKATGGDHHRPIFAWSRRPCSSSDPIICGDARGFVQPSCHHGELEAPKIRGGPVGMCTSPDQYVDDVIQLMKQHRVKRVLVLRRAENALSVW